MRVLSVTGGKGGIGKTTISVNLAIAMANLRKKVILFDADLGLANVDILLGLKPTKNLYDVLNGTCKLSDICIAGPGGIKIIPSSSGIEKMADLTPMESAELIHSFSELTDKMDLMITDMASGISRQNIDFTHAAQDVLVVVCNEPASLMDSYAVIKILHQRYARGRFGIVVNKVKNRQEGLDVFTHFNEAVTNFMNINMQYLGHIPQDDYVLFAAREHVPIVDRFPYCDASKAFVELSQRIIYWLDENQVHGGIHYFFEKLIQENTSREEKLCGA